LAGIGLTSSTDLVFTLDQLWISTMTFTKTRFHFLTVHGILLLQSCHGGVPTESIEATKRQGKRTSPSRHLKLTSTVVVEHPGLFSNSGGIEINPDYISAKYSSTVKQGRLHNRHRGGGGGSDDFVSIHMKNPRAPVFQDDFFTNDPKDRFQQQNESSGLSFTWQRQPTSITESLRNYFQTMLQQSPTSFWTFASCLVVFLLWQIFPRASWMYKYFVCTRQSTIQSRGMSLLLSSISHSSFRHFAVDLLALCHLAPKVWKHSNNFRFTNSGTTLGEIMDRPKRAATPLWPLFLGSGVFPHVLFVLVRKHSACLGLGGVIMALMGYYYGGVMPPNQTLNFMIGGILPVSIRAQLLVQVLLGVSLVGSFSSRSSIPHLVHLGGLIYGMVYYHGVGHFVNVGKQAWKDNVVNAAGKMGKAKRGFPISGQKR
jgi:hypothetical protein